MKNDERWLPVIGFEKYYEISDYGRVRRNGKVLKPYLNGEYLAVDFSVVSENVHRKCKTIHTLVAIHFIPKLTDKTVVNHLDHNKLNNHYTNLEWTTCSGNSIHMYKADRHHGNKGELNGRVKLTELDVISIRKSNLTTKQLMNVYGISQSHCRGIINGVYWKHI
jgi:hypothetical protein